MTEGKTLEELNVKAGDVVEYIYGKDAISTVTHFKDGRWYGDIGRYSDGPVFRIISRANDWKICPPDYEKQAHHECTYHMGIPVAYREIEVPLVDVERRVGFDGLDIDYSKYTRLHNATLRGQTRNGKPVGQWIIDMDESK